MAAERSCDAGKMRNRIGDGYKTGWKGSGMRSDSLSSKWIDIKNRPSHKM